MKDKEVCVRAWILLMRLRYIPATCHFWNDHSWTYSESQVKK